MGSTEAQGQQPSKSVAAIVALVLGIIALATSFLPIINNMSLIIGFIGLIFAIIVLVGTLRGKKSGKPLAIASLIVNALALVIVIASQSAYSAAIDEAIVDTSDGTVAGDASASSESSATTQSTSDEGDEEASQYTISDDQLVKDSYSCSIEGTFTNTSGKDLSYVGVSYNVFDADGTQIGNAYANTTNLADGASWKFDAYCTADVDEVASYQLADVTAY